LHLSPAEQLKALPTSEQDAFFASLTDDEADELIATWRGFWARPEQLAPAGDWSTWVILAGRGFGKTRSGAEWVRERWKQGAGRIGLIAETAADARDVLVEGKSGILSISPPTDRPIYEPSKRRLTWPNGAVATLYNGTEPDQLRGPEHDTVWVDELAKYRYPTETWDMLQFGLRLGDNPQACITTTPRPIPTLKRILSQNGTVTTRGSTFDNAANLPALFIDRIRERYEGTRLGRQELNAEILDDVPGALWTRDTIKIDAAMPEFQRIVVGVDPSGTGGDDDERADSVGIIVAGERIDGGYHVIQDGTCSLSPEGWSRRVVELADEHQADRIVAERNYLRPAVGKVFARSRLLRYMNKVRSAMRRAWKGLRIKCY
jgi:phage terminase large subunit-like protein